MSSQSVSSPKKICTLSVELPESVVQLLAPTLQEAALHLKELAFIELFRQGEVSSGWAAEQLGMSKTDFLDLLFRHDVPYFDMSEDELRQQVDAAMPRQDRLTS